MTDRVELAHRTVMSVINDACQARYMPKTQYREFLENLIGTLESSLACVVEELNEEEAVS